MYLNKNQYMGIPVFCVGCVSRCFYSSLQDCLQACERLLERSLEAARAFVQHCKQKHCQKVPCMEM